MSASSKNQCRQWEALRKRLRRKDLKPILFHYSNPPTPSERIIIDPGLMTSTPQKWGGGVWAVVPLRLLKLDLSFVESVLPLLADQKRVDSLGEAFVEAHLGHLAQWLAESSPAVRRNGGDSTHLHFGLCLSREPALQLIFHKDVILQHLGARNRTLLEAMHVFHGRLYRSDYRIEVKACNFHPSAWEGDLVITIRLGDIGMRIEDLEKLDSLLFGTTVWVDWLGEAILYSHTTAFGNFVAGLPPKIYDVAVNQFRHRHFGLTIDNEHEVIGFGFHVSAVRECIDYCLLQAAEEGSRL